jgi:DNA-binding response OmpR family regulator
MVNDLRPNPLAVGRDSGFMEAQHESLVVVEDPLVSNLVRAVLRRRGYRVMPAEIAEVPALLRGPEPFTGILVTNLPAAFLEFADAIRRILYLSSSPDPRLEALFPNCRVVRKPFAPEELVRAVEELERL